MSPVVYHRLGKEEGSRKRNPQGRMLKESATPLCPCLETEQSVQHSDLAEGVQNLHLTGGDMRDEALEGHPLAP